MDSLKSKAFRGLYWSFVESVGVQGVRFVIGIILARILFPEQFGLVGMLAIFMAVAQSILDSGFGAALIQKREATQTDYCSIFFFQLGIGLIVYIGLFLIAPWIASFYNQPMLAPLTRVLSLTVIINSFGWIHSTILSKSINFKIQTIISLVATTLSGIIGVSLALSGFGVWSLVAYQVLNALCRAILFWLLNSWRPALIFSRNSLKGMYKFGSRIFLSGLLNQIYDNIYYLVIGKLFSANALGYFTRAKAFADVPSNTLSVMVGRVAFPVFSTIQDSKIKLKNGLRRAMTTISFINFPLMICLVVIARNLVFALVTEKWAESVPYLQLLLFCGLLFPLHVICMDIIRALGRSNLFLIIEIIKKVLVTISIIVTYRWGLSAMIIGMIAVSVISYALSSYFVKVLIDYPFKEQIRDIIPYLFVSIISAITMFFIGMLPSNSYWVMLLFQIFSGTLVYLGLCNLLKLAALKEIRHVIRSMLR